MQTRSQTTGIWPPLIFWNAYPALAAELRAARTWVLELEKEVEKIVPVQSVSRDYRLRKEGEIKALEEACHAICEQTVESAAKTG